MSGPRSRVWEVMLESRPSQTAQAPRSACTRGKAKTDHSALASPSAPGSWRPQKRAPSGSKSGSGRWSHWDEIGWVHYPEIGWSHSDEIRWVQSLEILHYGTAPARRVHEAHIIGLKKAYSNFPRRVTIPTLPSRCSHPPQTNSVLHPQMGFELRQDVEGSVANPLAKIRLPSAIAERSSVRSGIPSIMVLEPPPHLDVG